MFTETTKDILKKIDFEAVANQIEATGLFVVKDVFPKEVIREYYESCKEQFAHAARLEGKNYASGVTPNYVQPWMINTEAREVASYRLYEFYHNPMKPVTKHICDTVIAIRDGVESRWPEIQDFNKKNNFVDYNIVAKYAPNSGYQSKHSDMDPTVPHPALQAQIMLTEAGGDYNGGSLVLYLNDGRVVELLRDYNIAVGDLILFDKRIAHEVSMVSAGTGENRGRWMALIGAKTFPRSESKFFRDKKIQFKRFLFLKVPFVHKVLKIANGYKV